MAASKSAEGLFSRVGGRMSEMKWNLDIVSRGWLCPLLNSWMSSVVVLKIDRTRCRRDVWLSDLKLEVLRSLVSVVDKMLQRIEDRRQKGENREEEEKGSKSSSSLAFGAEPWFRPQPLLNFERPSMSGTRTICIPHRLLW
jgi:hypothetical protein